MYEQALLKLYAKFVALLMEEVGSLPEASREKYYILNGIIEEMKGE